MCKDKAADLAGIGRAPHPDLYLLASHIILLKVV
jgi:hypothetical protein